MHLEFTATLLYQATPGKPLATQPLRTTGSGQHRLLKGHELPHLYSRQPSYAALDRCLFMSDSGSASDSSFTQQISYCTYIASWKLLEFLSIFSVSLDWIHSYAETRIYFFRDALKKFLILQFQIIHFGFRENCWKE